MTSSSREVNIKLVRNEQRLEDIKELLSKPESVGVVGQLAARLRPTPENRKEH
jgi:hypothetical protein